ncbi:MAG: hypothetical protein VX768_16435 [Planctomycetota bacterium]|nr:hypothetical protein [Planctomycetota bacterium]
MSSPPLSAQRPRCEFKYLNWIELNPPTLSKDQYRELLEKARRSGFRDSRVEWFLVPAAFLIYAACTLWISVFPPGLPLAGAISGVAILVLAVVQHECAH